LIRGGIKFDYEETTNSEEEKRADEFAANMLIDPNRYGDFLNSNLNSKDFSLKRINDFCSEIGVPNFILIGRLQKEGYLNYSHYSGEKVRYEV